MNFDAKILMMPPPIAVSNIETNDFPLNFPDVTLLRCNDEVAWGEAYPLLWKAAICTISNRFKGCKSDIENMASNTLCDEVIPGILEGKESFANIHSFQDLIKLTKKIAVHRCIDEIRRKIRRNEVSLDHAPSNLLGTCDAEGGASMWCEYMILIENELEPPDPELFEDRFLFGYTTDEIAERHKMPRGTVLSRIDRACKRLSKLASFRLMRMGGLSDHEENN